MKLVEARRFWALLLAAAVVVPAARGIWFDMPSSGSKCVSEELRNNAVVLADFYSLGEHEDVNSTVAPTISVKVTSPYGNELYHTEKVRYGQFSFTTREDGNYLACFWVDGNDEGGKTVTVGIEWKTGIAAKDWDSVARKEKIEGLELELRKLEGAVQAIHENMNNLMARELWMRSVSEKTNARVAWYSITSLGVCIVVSITQSWYLKRYFHKKKLI
ncbi:Transmembrane emp24 domain-containing protein p24delta3 [Sesamum alatum]|uniref:Transmembrane emp24 domain-containing protein p24delta3 n=1 Tax=Sesamum alatum TaxID=300844 RepID=A0AAE1YP79_9LAMI|nr:Transmembrane emp24 domain-containing protein p24delta3 [Sesamum alatum]